MDGSSNMDNSIRYRIVLGISITTLLIFGLYTFPLSQRTNAQLQSDKLDYKMMASDNNIFSNRWIPPSYVTISLGRNSSEAAGGNNNNNNAVVTWNQLITTIGLEKKIPPPYLARDYALMHIAIYDALLQPTNKTNNNEKPAELAIVAGARSRGVGIFIPRKF